VTEKERLVTTHLKELLGYKACASSCGQAGSLYACKVVGGRFELVICFVQRAEVGTVGIWKGSEAVDGQMGSLSQLLVATQVELTTTGAATFPRISPVSIATTRLTTSWLTKPRFFPDTA